MLGRFLACFALLTGLAAVGTPANASLAEAVSCEVGVAADAVDVQAAERRDCDHENANDRADEADKAKQPAKRSKRVIRPPVLYGIDRAYE